MVVACRGYLHLNVCIRGYPNASSKDLDQTAHAQSDLNLHWTHMFKGTFSDAVNSKTMHTLIVNFIGTSMIYAT